MSTIRFEVTDKQMKELETKAKELNISVQDYVRMKVLGIEVVFNKEKIIECIKEHFGNSGDLFTLHDIFVKCKIDQSNARLYGKRLKKLSQTKIDGKYLFEETSERWGGQTVYKTI